MPPTTLRDIVNSRELKLSDFARSIGCSDSHLYKIFDPKLFPPNHPIIPKIAQVLGLSVSEVAVFARAEPLTDGKLRMVNHRLGKDLREILRREPGTALVRHKSTVPARRGRPPKQASTAVKRRNALLRMETIARQTARSLATATTVAAMRGQKFMDASAPVEGMALILNDYFALKGINKQVVLDVDYEDIFG